MGLLISANVKNTFWEYGHRFRAWKAGACLGGKKAEVGWQGWGQGVQIFPSQLHLPTPPSRSLELVSTCSAL